MDKEELPAICGDPEAARILGMHQDWVAFLESKQHLKSLGGRTKGCQRYYSSRYVFSLKDDVGWLDRAIKLVRAHFRAKNAASGGSGE